MKVFISYSRKDEAVTNLLAMLLKDRGIECLYDRRLEPAAPFDSNLRGMIQKADLVLVLLTSAALSSSWVNQEIGYALALQKPVWPLAMERDIEPQGLILRIQSYSLFDWSDPDRTVTTLVESLKTHGKKTSDPYMAFGLSQVLEGRVARTDFLVRHLESLRDDETPEVTVRNQAAFSIFCASGHDLYREAGKHSDEYMKLLLKEQELLLELIDLGRIRLRLILWPVRAYEEKYLAVRYETLLKWMEERIDDGRVEYIVAQYSGPSRYIVGEQLCLEGFKLHHTSGYKMSIVHYDRERIDKALMQFDVTFFAAQSTKEAAIREVKRRFDETLGL